MADTLSPERLETLEALLIELNAVSAKAILPLFRVENGLVDKGPEGFFDPVTEADKGAEAVIRKLVSERFPDHGFIGEEYGEERADAEFVWVLDPIDGTRAFIAGLPVWTTLIGLRFQGQPVLGSIGQPFLDEIFLGAAAGSRLLSRGQSRPLKVRRCPLLTDAIIATNDISASYLKREATVIPHGVDTDTYAPPADRAAAFAEAKLPGRYAIGCFGRVRAQKGTDVFVDAMCRLLPRYPDFTAVIVGAIVPEQIAFASDLKKRIEAAGLQSRIVMTGELPIEQVQRWYQRLTIYAFTSRNEGFGLTLIEAMSAGAALVASRAGAAELVVENGVTGVLTPPGDVDALVAGLEPLLRDPVSCTAMGTRARTRVLEKFSLDAEAGRIAEVYSGLAVP